METPSTALTSSGSTSCESLSPWPGCPMTHSEPGRLQAANELGLVDNPPRADMQKYIHLCKGMFQVGAPALVPHPWRVRHLGAWHCLWAPHGS